MLTGFRRLLLCLAIALIILLPVASAPFEERRTAERRTYADVLTDVGSGADYRTTPFVYPLGYKERPVMPVPEFANWMAGENEARWHQIEKAGPRPLAYCGHRIKGEVHRRITENLPNYQDGRMICRGCLATTISMKQSRESKGPR